MAKLPYNPHHSCLLAQHLLHCWLELGVGDELLSVVQDRDHSVHSPEHFLHQPVLVGQHQLLGWLPHQVLVALVGRDLQGGLEGGLDRSLLWTVNKEITN